jgi:hypothetical protein
LNTQLGRQPALVDVDVFALQNAYEYNYGARHRGVFPMKVNQRRSVVERLVSAGHRYEYGLEVGTKAELAEILAIYENENVVTDEDRAEWRRIREQIGTVYCRRCSYCMPCPNEVQITTLTVMDSFVRRFPKERMVGEEWMKVLDLVWAYPWCQPTAWTLLKVWQSLRQV